MCPGSRIRGVWNIDRHRGNVAVIHHKRPLGIGIHPLTAQHPAGRAAGGDFKKRLQPHRPRTVRLVSVCFLAYTFHSQERHSKPVAPVCNR